MPPNAEPAGAGSAPTPDARVVAHPLRRYDEASELFRALAAPIRIAIVELLAEHGQLYVYEIVDAVGVAQALVSQHLRVLRQARIVLRVQMGRQTAYRLSNPAAKRIIGEAFTAHDGSRALNNTGP